MIVLSLTVTWYTFTFTQCSVFCMDKVFFHSFSKLILYFLRVTECAAQIIEAVSLERIEIRESVIRYGYCYAFMGMY